MNSATITSFVFRGIVQAAVERESILIFYYFNSESE